MIQIFDNYLDDEKSNVFLELLEKCEIPLFFSSTTTGVEQPNESPQFTHLFLQDNKPSFLYDRFLKVFNKIPEFVDHELVRAKLNVQTSYRECLVHPFHTDGDSGDITYLYYLNDSDGPTIVKIEDQVRKIKPVKNRMVRFPANLMHASSAPYNSTFRAVINIVMRPKK